MAEIEKDMSERFSQLGKTLFNDIARRMAALYIDTGEELARGALEIQARATEWAKDTPFAPWFEAQDVISRRLVELSVSGARRLWQIEEKRAA
jgi:hypothetical protein